MGEGFNGSFYGKGGLVVIKIVIYFYVKNNLNTFIYNCSTL